MNIENDMIIQADHALLGVENDHGELSAEQRSFFFLGYIHGWTYLLFQILEVAALHDPEVIEEMIDHVIEYWSKQPPTNPALREILEQYKKSGKN